MVYLRLIFLLLPLSLSASISTFRHVVRDVVNLRQLHREQDLLYQAGVLWAYPLFQVDSIFETVASERSNSRSQLLSLSSKGSRLLAEMCYFQRYTSTNSYVENEKNLSVQAYGKARHLSLLPFTYFPEFRTESPFTSFFGLQDEFFNRDLRGSCGVGRETFDFLHSVFQHLFGSTFPDQLNLTNVIQGRLRDSKHFAFPYTFSTLMHGLGKDLKIEQSLATFHSANKIMLFAHFMAANAIQLRMRDPGGGLLARQLGIGEMIHYFEAQIAVFDTKRASHPAILAHLNFLMVVANYTFSNNFGFANEAHCFLMYRHLVKDVLAELFWLTKDSQLTAASRLHIVCDLVRGNSQLKYFHYL